MVAFKWIVVLFEYIVVYVKEAKTLTQSWDTEVTDLKSENILYCPELKL